MHPTITSIAKEAGVSVPTVSKVLNGRADVSAATREHVEEILERRNYRRRRSTASMQSNLIDLVFHELDSAWSIEIIRGVEAVAAPQGIGVVLSELSGKNRPEQDLIDTILARRPLGVLLVLSSLTAAQQHQLETRSIPFVVLDTDGEPPSGVPSVGSNNWNGGFTATRHLLDLGHRKIAIISGPPSVLCSRARVDGFTSAHAAAGASHNPNWVFHGDFLPGGGYAAAIKLLSQRDRPTAIFAGSDMQALGVIRAARELGLNVPQDLSVVGYDNLPLVEWLDTPLTTVNQPLQSMAGTATNMLISLAKQEQVPNLQIDLATELVVRASTAPPGL